MREIKFRGFSDDEDKWVFGYLMWNKYGDYFIGTSDGVTYSVKKESVGEWAGRQDYNIKDIYEGDFVLADKIKTEIVWYQGSFYCQEKDSDLNNKDKLWHNPLSKCDDIKFEVIGNKFQNPELMEEGL